ncbi:MAG: Tol-Pal system beta propeller repeat protein TolB [Acidocella sp.]|nr:Tol-Pal system beta propeller repeat protein TolB [Acidocella sp.]
MNMTRRLLSLSRRGLLGSGAAGLLLPRLAHAQSALGGADTPAPAAASNNGPAINVSGAQNAPIPIAIPTIGDPTGAPSSIGAQISQVLTDDLGHSGLFRPIDSASFVPNSIVNGVPVWQNWSILGAQALITGDVADAGGGQLRVEFRLWSVTQQQQVQGTAYTTTPDNWRRIAHIIGDVVYKQLIGENGYFDSRVAYISEAGPVTSPVRRLAVMDYDGANNKFLTNGDSMALSPQFNPTRQQLAFVSFQNNQPRVYLFDLQTGHQSLVGSFGEMTIGPKFSPDGNSLLMSVSRGNGAALVKVSASGGGMQQLTDSSSINVTPSYSPDGSQIAFNSDRDGNQQLFVMNSDGSGVKRISFGDGQYAEPAWSPRGDLIAYTRWGSGGFSIGVMQPDGSGERILSQGFLVESATFCPNGRVIMFYRQTPSISGHDSRLVTIGIDGFNERLVDTPTNASDPSWSPLLS